MLEKDPHHGKALCTQGRAYMHLGDLDKAKESLDAAAEVSPDDPLIKKEMAKVKAHLKNRDRKEKEAWGKAFEKVMTTLVHWMMPLTKTCACCVQLGSS